MKERKWWKKRMKESMLCRKRDERDEWWKNRMKERKW